MKRRSFIVGASLAVVAGPAWLRRAFADASIVTPNRRGVATVAQAQARAQAAGRPLFAIVVPHDDDAKDERGTLWGEYLNHGAASQLAPLGLAEVVCAELRDLPSDRARRAVDDKRTLALVIEPDGSVQALSAKVPDYANLGYPNVDGRAHEDAVTWQRIARMAEMVRRGLAVDDKMLERRAADVRAARGPGAPVVTALVPDSVKALAADVRARLRDTPPPGAHWARAGGCGLDEVEGMDETEPMGIGCGMGHLPEMSTRFLYFYTKTPGQLWRERDAQYDREAEAKKK
jgi:hypothetical protein